MMQIFSKTRTLISQILILSPLLSILTADWPKSFWLPFFCSMLLSLFPLKAAMKYLPFRIWLVSCILLGIAGTLSAALQNPSISTLPSAILLGCSACGLFLLLPPWIAVGRYISASPALGLVWSCSLLLSVPLQLFIQHTASSGLILGAVMMISGFIFFSRRAPHIQLLKPPPHDFFSPSMVKVILFFLCLLTSIGVCSGILAEKSITTPSSDLLSALALACGPMLSSCFTEKKGIYSSCILSIFLTETALLLTCSSTSPAVLNAGRAVLSLSAGTTIVILPILAFYLCGRTGYMHGFAPLGLCIPVSLLFSWPLRNMTVSGELLQQDTAAFLLFLLISSFLCIFFAWKRRFIILKNKRI